MSKARISEAENASFHDLSHFMGEWAMEELPKINRSTHAHTFFFSWKNWLAITASQNVY